MKKIVLGTLFSLLVTAPALANCTSSTLEEPYVNVCGVQGHKECVKGKVELTRGPEKCAHGKVRNCANATQPTCDSKSKHGDSDDDHDNQGHDEH